MKIGIIIPCYYESSLISNLFKSLNEQTQRDKIKIIMINDCSPNTSSYYDLREEFSLLDITYLETPKNSGPGVARQLGLEFCQTEYVMFIDDDDILNNPYVIESYLNIISNKKQNEIIGFIAAQRLNGNNIEFTGLTGSIFNNNIIKFFNISFSSKFKYGEDILFFMQYFFYIDVLKNIYNNSIIVKEDSSFIAYNYNRNNINSLTRDISNNFILNAINLLNILDEISLFYSQFNYLNYTKIIMNNLLYIGAQYFFLIDFLIYNNESINDYIFSDTIKLIIKYQIDLTKIDYIKSQDSFLEEFNFNSFNTCRYLLRELKYELD